MTKYDALRFGLLISAVAALTSIARLPDNLTYVLELVSVAGLVYGSTLLPKRNQLAAWYVAAVTLIMLFIHTIFEPSIDMADYGGIEYITILLSIILILSIPASVYAFWGVAKKYVHGREVEQYWHYLFWGACAVVAFQFLALGVTYISMSGMMLGSMPNFTFLRLASIAMTILGVAKILIFGLTFTKMPKHHAE